VHEDDESSSGPAVASFEDDLFQLIETCSQSLLYSATQLQLHQYTTIAPGGSTVVSIDSALAPEHRAAAKTLAENTESAQPFQLQLVSVVSDPLVNEMLVPKFSRDSVWTIRFYADAAHTVLLKEMRVTSDPQTRIIPPFVVSDPVHIVASHSTKSLAKSKDTKATPASAKAKQGPDEIPVTLSITPFTHDSLELMTVLTEAIVHIRRMQIAGMQVLLAQPGVDTAATTRSKPSAFVFSATPASATFLHTLITSTSLSTTLDHFLTILYEGCKDFVDVYTQFVPIPSNPRVRAHDSIALILATEIVAKKSNRDEHGVVRQPVTASSSTSDEETEEDVSWLIESVLPEAKARLAAERGQYPMQSVYLQRLVELLLVAVRYEWMQRVHESIDIGDEMATMVHHERGTTSEGQLRVAIQKELPAVLSLEHLLLHATSSAAHPPASETASEAPECTCAWCAEMADMREDVQQISALLDLSSTSSIVATLMSDLDCFPDVRDVETGLKTRNQSARTQLSRILAAAAADELSLTSSPVAASPTLTPIGETSTSSSSSFAAIFHAFNTASSLLRPDALLSSSVPSGSTEPAASGSSATSTAFVPTETRASFAWRHRVSLADRLLPISSLRARLLHLLLNGTSAPNLPRPEIAFRRGAEKEEMTSITQAKHLYRTLPHTHPASSTTASKEARKRALLAGDEALGRGNMFQQLVDAFLKANLHSKSISLRAEVGAVTFKCILSGVLDQGAAGLPGPFRQALAEIVGDLNRQAWAYEALDSAAMETGPSLFIPTPNSRSQTGDDRNKLLLNPSLLQKGEISLVKCRVFGQLIGIAIRSKCSLAMDLSSVFWKQLLEQPLTADDLESFDFTASKSLKFIDPTNDLPFTLEEFDEYLGYLTWTTVLSDGTTQVELKPGGASQKVHYHQRYQYAAKAIEARLQESALLITSIREGLLSVIPQQALHLLSWRELELRVCGRPTIELAVLERHTVYSPSSFTRSTPIVSWFWQILAGFSQEDLGRFLQFAWARSRLPAEDQHGAYRMQINFIQAQPKTSSSNSNHPQSNPNDMLLPTSETCFFNGEYTRCPPFRVRPVAFCPLRAHT
jgi:hypothetical protein